MEEEGEGAAGELKILSSVFRSPRAVSVRHHLSCLPGTLSLSLARERGGAEKKKTARLGAKTHFEESERECINFFLFSANDESFLLSLSLFHLNRCRSRSSGCKGSSSAAPSTIRARRAAGLGKGRRGGLLSVSFRILFFFFFFFGGSSGQRCRQRRHCSLVLQCPRPVTLHPPLDSLEFCSLRQHKTVI